MTYKYDLRTEKYKIFIMNVDRVIQIKHKDLIMTFVMISN